VQIRSVRDHLGHVSAPEPAWTTVVISVISAFIGGGAGAIVTVMLQSRHQRQEAWRSRLVPAADDFSTGVLQALLVHRDAVNVVRIAVELQSRAEERGEVADVHTSKVRAVLRTLTDRVDVAHSRLPRIQLLFGTESPTAKAGLEAILALRRGNVLLSQRPTPDVTEARRAAADAQSAQSRFAEAARGQIERGDIAAK
jgi:hypothetical protein